jgi:hypothetical protein
MDTKKMGSTVLNLVDTNQENKVSKSYIHALGNRKLKEKEINGG